MLLAAARAELERRGVAASDRSVAWVPGAFELPLAAMMMARTACFDAVVCLGAVIRGETSHYDFVAGECAAGIQRVQLEMKLPVVFGVLTTENLDQALARAGGAVGNKGIEAVATAVEMVNLLRHARWERCRGERRSSAGLAKIDPIMLRLVLPKGSLELADLRVVRRGRLGRPRASEVAYRAAIDDPRIDEVHILRPQEIPSYVAEGLFDLGVTGRDWVEETARRLSASAS